MSLSPLIRFGTSTWAYEGWQGQVYKKTYAKSAFARECLGEYCQYQYQGKPLFRTVGNDSTFYRPPTANQLRHYLKQIPEDFEMCFKVWEEITSYAKQARYGAKAGHRTHASLTPNSSPIWSSHPTTTPVSIPTPAPFSSSSNDMA